MKLPPKKHSTALTDLFPLVVILLFTIIVTITCRSQKLHYNNDITDLTSGWTSSEGESISIDNLPVGDIVLSHDLTNIDLDRKRLCLNTVHTYIKVEADGVLIYDYAPEQAPILGKSYGMYIHMIPIPTDTSTLTLTLHPLYNHYPQLKHQKQCTKHAVKHSLSTT